MKEYIPTPVEQQYLSKPTYTQRMLAFLIDAGILGFTIFAPFSALLEKKVPAGDFKTVYASIAQQTSTTTALSIALFFVFFLILLYFALCEYFVGQTAGKRVMHLKVEDYYGNTPTFMQCLLRNVQFLLLFPFWILLLVEPIYLAVTKQRLLEHLSKTRTVYTNTNYMNKEKTNTFLPSQR